MTTGGLSNLNFNQSPGFNLHDHGLPAAETLAAATTTLATVANTSALAASTTATTDNLGHCCPGHDTAATTHILAVVATIFDAAARA